LKKHKSPDSDKIPAELIQAGGQILLLPIHELINLIWNKEELPDQVEGVYYCTHSEKRVIKLTVIIIVGYHCYNHHTQLY
jgi:hypothetical protein